MRTDDDPVRNEVMEEYMKIGGFTPPKTVSKQILTKSPAVKRFDSLERLPNIVQTDKALTPGIPKNLKVPKDEEATR